MSADATIEDKIRRLWSGSKSVEEVIQEANKVRDSIKEAEGITDDLIVTEARDRYVEKGEKTVLISENNPVLANALADRLKAEHFRVVRYDNVGSLNEYIACRRSKEFFLVGIIADLDFEDASSQRSKSLQFLLENTRTPCISLSHNKNRHSIVYQNYEPRPPTQEHEKIQRIFNAVLLQTEQHMERPTQAIPANVLLSNDEDLEKKALRAEKLRKSVYWYESIKLYSEILETNRYHVASIIGYASLLLRQQMRNQLNLVKIPPGTDQDGSLEGLVQFLQETKLSSPVSEFNYLLGKARVLLYKENVKKTEPEGRESVASEKTKLLLDAISNIEDYRVTTPYNMDALGYLALAYAMLGTEEGRIKSFELVSWASAHVDLLSEPISASSIHEAYFAEIMQDEDIYGSRLMQLLGLNRVIKIGEDLVAKEFISPTKLQKAQNEVSNYSGLSGLPGELKVRIGRTEHPIWVPTDPCLVHQEPLSSQKRQIVFELIPFMPDISLEKAFARIDADPRYSNSLADDIKVSHLEWVMDASACIQSTATKKLRLNDVRTPAYRIIYNLEGTQRVSPVGFYTWRVFNKLIEGEKKPAVVYEDTGPRTKMTGIQKARFIEIISDLEEKLRNAPEWLWLFYTDGNIGNYLVQYTGTNPETHEDWVVNSSKSRVDLENRDVRLGIADAVTAAEHELSAMKSAGKASSIHKNNAQTADYLINRWLARVVIQMVPAQWAKNPPTSEQTFAYEQFKNKVEPLLDNEVNGKKRNGLNNYLSTYLPRIQPGFSMKTFRELHYIESLLRHLTIAGDKESDLRNVTHITDQMEEKYPNLKQFKPFSGSYTKTFEMMTEIKQRYPPDRVEYSYCYAKSIYEKILTAREHHHRYVLQRIDDLKLRGLKMLIKTIFNGK